MNFSQLSFGFFQLKIYGLLLSLAFMVGAWKYYKAIQAKKLPTDFFLHHFWKWVVGGVLIGRLFSVILFSEVFDAYGVFAFLAFWDGGISVLGAILGFLGFMVWDLFYHKQDYWRWLDAGILPVFLALMVVDVAGFLTGAVYGTETSFFWGVQYETFGVDTLNPVHPVSLYAFLFHLWFWFWFKKRAVRFDRTPGKIFLIGGFVIGIGDFFLQFLREDATFWVAGIVRVEQIFDLVGLVVLYFLFASLKRVSGK